MIAPEYILGICYVLLGIIVVLIRRTFSVPDRWWERVLIALLWPLALLGMLVAAGVGWIIDRHTDAELLKEQQKLLVEQGYKMIKQNDQLRMEIAMLRGQDCQADGDGPCGCCIKCLRAQAKDYQALKDENEALKIVIGKIREGGAL